MGSYDNMNIKLNQNSAFGSTFGTLTFCFGSETESTRSRFTFFGEAAGDTDFASFLNGKSICFCFFINVFRLRPELE